tara:strand:+ start:1358 stop:1594 length:237 start_codon:yes stop_codon:yes gene_type:complete
MRSDKQETKRNVNGVKRIEKNIIKDNVNIRRYGGKKILNILDINTNNGVTKTQLKIVTIGRKGIRRWRKKFNVLSVLS